MCKFMTDVCVSIASMFLVYTFFAKTNFITMLRLKLVKNKNKLSAFIINQLICLPHR